MTKLKKWSAATTTIVSSKKGPNAFDVATRAPNIEWIKNPSWTWTLITYLTNHPDFRQKIFSDCTAEERHAKQVGKESKTQQYAVLTEAIFSKESTQVDNFKANPQRYATSVETRLRR